MKETFPPQVAASSLEIESKKIEDSDNINEFIRKTIVNDLNNVKTIKTQISTLFEDKKKTESFGIVDMHVVIPSAVANNFDKLEYNLVVRKHKSKELTYDKATSIIKKHKNSNGPYTELSNSIKTRIKSLFSLNAKSPVNINGINGAAVTYNPQGKKIFIRRRTMHIVAEDSLLKDSYIDDLILFAIGLNKAPQQQLLQLNLQTPTRQTLTTTIVNNDNAQRISDNPLIELSTKFNYANAKTNLSEERIYIYEMKADYFENLGVKIHFDTKISIHEKMLLAAYEWGGVEYKEHWTLGDDYMKKLFFFKDFVEYFDKNHKAQQDEIVNIHQEYVDALYTATKNIGAPYVIQKEIYDAINFKIQDLVQNIDTETIDALGKFVKSINKKTTIMSGWRPPIYNQLNLNISGKRSKTHAHSDLYRYPTMGNIFLLSRNTYSEFGNVSVSSNTIKLGTKVHKRQRAILSYPPLGQGNYNLNYIDKYLKYTGLEHLKKIRQNISIDTTTQDIWKEKNNTSGAKNRFDYGIPDAYLVTPPRVVNGNSKLNNPEFFFEHKEHMLENKTIKTLWNKKAGIAHPYTSQHANGAAIDIMINDIVTKKGSATGKLELINIVNKLKDAGFKYVKFYESTGHIHVDTKVRGNKDFIFDGNSVLTTKDYDNH